MILQDMEHKTKVQVQVLEVLHKSSEPNKFFTNKSCNKSLISSK